MFQCNLSNCKEAWKKTRAKGLYPVEAQNCLKLIANATARTSLYTVFYVLLILVTTAVNPKLPVVPTTSYVTTVPSTVHEHQSTTTTSSVTPTPTKEITVTKHSGTAGKE